MSDMVMAFFRFLASSAVKLPFSRILVGSSSMFERNWNIISPGMSFFVLLM